MTITEAFKKYNAILKNIDLSICAENYDEELVIRLWGHCVVNSSDNTIRYRDQLIRWSGPGNYELCLALDKAKETNQIIRAVIAHGKNLEAVEAWQDASKYKNAYSVRKNWIGTLEFWDGYTYEIKFRYLAPFRDQLGNTH